jgi:hypothetical protein
MLGTLMMEGWIEGEGLLAKVVVLVGTMTGMSIKSIITIPKTRTLSVMTISPI